MNAGRRTLLRAIAAGAFALLPEAGVCAPARVRRLCVLWDEPGAKGVLPPLLKELGALGIAEGRDFVVQLCDRDKASGPECASTLVRAECDVIFTTSTHNTRALQQATRTIPIVTGVGDPVGSGFAASLARPGGNITGLAVHDGNEGRKLVGLARLVIPRLTGAVVIVGAQQEHVHESARRMQTVVSESGISCRLAFLDSMKAVEHELRSMRKRGEQLAVAYHIELGDRTEEAITRLAIRHQVALVSHEPEWIRAGGLLSYATFHRNADRRQASKIAKIFRGANPATIPFELPDATEIVVNRTTAAKLGLRIPPEVLIAATEIVE